MTAETVITDMDSIGARQAGVNHAGVVCVLSSSVSSLNRKKTSGTSRSSTQSREWQSVATGL